MTTTTRLPIFGLVRNSDLTIVGVLGVLGAAIFLWPKASGNPPPPPGGNSVNSSGGYFTLTASPTTGTHPLPVRFSYTMRNSAVIVTNIQLVADDGLTGGQLQPDGSIIHTYSIAGTFNATLTLGGYIETTDPITHVVTQTPVTDSATIRITVL